MDIRKKTFGINFPFVNSNNGDYLGLTEIPEREIKANLVHLLLTKKGSRYFMPEFGTNLYQYIFEPMSEELMLKIEDEINAACENFIPNLKINKINITTYYDKIEYLTDDKSHHTITIKIDYTVQSRTFESSSTVTLTF